MDSNKIRELLASVAHPATGLGVEVRSLSVSDSAARITVALPRARDPHASSLKKQIERKINSIYPDASVTVFFEEPSSSPRVAEKRQPAPAARAGVARVIAVASGKGGVGKSTVAANLALALSGEGYRVGILDADIYGPSQPILFGVQEYRPPVETIDGVDMMLPAEAKGVKVMSIGFFIDPSEALVWRGPMATNALRQMIAQTLWGELDCLLVDMPPGTGDVHLTILQQMEVSGAIVVTTPQRLSVADAVRGIAMFRSEKIAVRVLGVVENMAWFEPAEMRGNRYHIFGRDGGARLAAQEGVPLLARIPLVMSRDEDSSPIVDNAVLADEYRSLAQQVVRSLEC